MNGVRIVLFLLLFPHGVFAGEQVACGNWPSWARKICLRPYQTWTQGKNELYGTGYAWHNRYYYARDRLDRYNELAWGGGLGKSFYDEDGDWHGLFGMAFLDSHKYLEPMFGYAFLKMFHFSENARIGLGYGAFLTQRPDIFKGVPFPGALPWASLSYRRFTLSAAYVPGHKNVGNVLFLLVKWVL